MALKQKKTFNWHNNRLTIFLGFIMFLFAVFYFLSYLFSTEGPEIRTFINDQGLEVVEYYYDHSPNPFKVVYKDGDGNISEKWSDLNTNGHFESKFFYINGELTNMDISLADDGTVDLKRLIQGGDSVEEYDRNHDGYFEEKHILKDGKRVKDTIDRNNDHNPEQEVFYDSKGKVEKMILDFNSDGRADVTLPKIPKS